MSESTDRKLCPKCREGFFRRNLFVILAFLVPAAIMLLAFALNRFYPFGNKMIMVADSWHQYYPFLVEYQHKLKSGESLMYSWNTGGGANFLGVLGNYLGSPLYLFARFIPSGTPWLQVYLAFTVAVRVGCAGGFSAIFFRKVFLRNDLSLVYFSLMYALCAYITGYYWNMMWLDTVALLPLVAAGVISVLRDRRFSLYIISLALAVLCNFYIGYMVCLFVLLFSVCYTIVTFAGFKESLKNAGKMLLYTLVAFMITAAVTVPVFMALQMSDSSSDVAGFPTIYTVNYGFGYNDGQGWKYQIISSFKAIVRTLGNLIAYTRPITMDRGAPNIACGVLSLVLGVFYFTTGKIKLKEKLISGSVLVFFVLSFVVNHLNYIWHGMNTPAMVYYRWSFIFSFALVVLAYRAFTLVDKFSKISFIAASVIIVLYLAMSYFVQRKISIAVTAVLVGAFITLMLLHRAGKLDYRIFSLLLCVLVVGEMGFNAYYGVRTVGSTKIDDFPQNYAEVSELEQIALEDSAEGELYRTEFLKYYSLNDGDMYGMYGITTFNSMVNSSYTDFMSEMGLASSVINNRYAYFETSPVTNLFLNVKYLIGRDGQTAADSRYTQAVATTDECTLYKNTAYVPMGFMAEKKLADITLHDESYFPINAQSDIFAAATGIEDELFEAVSPSVTLRSKEDGVVLCRQQSDTDVFSVDLKDMTPEKDSKNVNLSTEYDIPEDGTYYGMFYSSSEGKVEIIVNDDEDNPIKLNQDYVYLAALGDFAQGDHLRVNMGAEKGKISSLTTTLVRINDDVFDRGVERLRQDTMTPTEWSDTCVKGTINASEDGLFYTSVFYDEGWTAYVDGEKAEIIPVADTCIALELSQGEHTIELRYSSPGFWAGVAVSMVGIAAFVILCVLSLRCRKHTPNVCLDTEGTPYKENNPEEDSTFDSEEAAVFDENDEA
ncbi:MAG: YfhO family protein [Ruminococcus sp.]|nr:YfhO family protein [Ruminococcus sp.]